MDMRQIIIDSIPVPWASHKGYGRTSFNPRFHEKNYYQWQIRSQIAHERPLSGPIDITVIYHMPIPSSTSKVRKLQMANGIIHHIKRPDVDNLNKFLFDCLKGIVFEDDSQVDHMDCRKIYGEKPKTVIICESK